MSSVGPTTTMLVIAGAAPFGYSVRTSGAFRRAEQYRRTGGTIRILSEQDLGLLHPPPALASASD